jgi:hypothetical protein
VVEDRGLPDGERGGLEALAEGVRAKGAEGDAARAGERCCDESHVGAQRTSGAGRG